MPTFSRSWGEFSCIGREGRLLSAEILLSMGGSDSATTKISLPYEANA